MSAGLFPVGFFFFLGPAAKPRDELYRGLNSFAKLLNFPGVSVEFNTIQPWQYNQFKFKSSSAGPAGFLLQTSSWEGI